jgi:hypothetical protein
MEPRVIGQSKTDPDICFDGDHASRSHVSPNEIRRLLCADFVGYKVLLPLAIASIPATSMAAPSQVITCIPVYLTRRHRVDPETDGPVRYLSILVLSLSTAKQVKAYV